MKRFLIVGTVLAVAIAGLVWSGIRLGDIARAVALVGWGILLAILVRYALTLMLAYSSWVIMPRDQRPKFHQSAAIRIVRDTVNTLLPTTQIGGDIVAARLMTFRGLTAPMAAAGVVVDLFLQVVSQFVFTLGGTLLLLQLGADPSIIRTVVTGLLIAVPLLVAFYFIQRLGVRCATGDRAQEARRWSGMVGVRRDRCLLCGARPHPRARPADAGELGHASRGVDRRVP